MMPLLILDIFHHGKKRHDHLEPEAEACTYLQIVPRKGRVYVSRWYTTKDRQLTRSNGIPCDNITGRRCSLLQQSVVLSSEQIQLAPLHSPQSFV